MPGERGDRVQLPAHPGQVRQAQVPRGMGGEPRKVGRQRNSPHHLRPGPQRHRFGVVAARLRQKQTAPGPAQRRPVPQILRQQHARGRRVRHHPLTAGLRRLRTHPQGAVRRVEIVAAQRAQFLSPQRRVIGQREHHPIPDRLIGEHRQQSQPVGLTRDPRQLHHPRHQRARPPTRPARRITAPANRIRLPHPFFDQEVVEQSNRHHYVESDLSLEFRGYAAAAAQASS